MATNYVVQMSKFGGGTYKLMDEEARSLISTETTQRQSAISSEASAREAADAAEASARETAIAAEAAERKKTDILAQRILDFEYHEKGTVYDLGAFEDGGIAADGSFETRNNYERTDYILLNKSAKNLYFSYEKTVADNYAYGAFYDENHDVVNYPYGSNGISFRLNKDNNIPVPQDAVYFAVAKAKAYNLFAYATSDENIKSNAVAIGQVSGAEWVALDLSVMTDGAAFNSSGSRVTNTSFKSTGYIQIGENNGWIYAESDVPDNYSNNRNNWFFDANYNTLGRFYCDGRFTTIPKDAVYIGCTVGKEYHMRVYKLMKNQKDLAIKAGVGTFYREQLPSYWTEDYYLNDRITDILNRNAGTRMVVFTDSHYPANQKKSELIVPYVADAIGADNVVFGGDSISSAESTAAGELLLKSFYSRMQDAFPRSFRNVLGNHDRNTVEASLYPDVPLDDRIVSYRFLYRQAVLKWKNDIHWEHRDTDGDVEYTAWNYQHYYWDDYNNRIRYIVLYSGNTYEPDSLLQYLRPESLPSGQYVSQLYTQIEFLYDSIKTLSDGWGVFVMAHQICDETGPTPAGAAIFRLLNGVKERATADLGGYARFYTQNHPGAVFDCSNLPKVDVLGVWGGHYHKDVVGVYTGYDYTTQSDPWDNGETNASGTAKLAYIGTSCDSIGKRVEGSTPMEAGTITEQIIDVISINRMDRKIYVDRIGAGSNTEPSRIITY